MRSRFWLASVFLAMVGLIAGEGRKSDAHPGVVDVRGFGAIPDDLLDDTAAFQSAISAAGTGLAGAEVYVPRGVYRVSSQITIPRSMAIRGATRDTSIIEATNASQNVFVVQTTAGVTISDLQFRVQVGVVKSQGAAIVVTAPAPHMNHRTVLERLLILDHYTAVHFLNAVEYSLSASSIYTSRFFGVLVENLVEPDAGDGQIVGNIFNNEPLPEPPSGTYAVEHRSGGGLRLVGNKILGHSVGYRVAIADVQTSVALLSANSIENQTQACIQLRRWGTTGQFSSVTITGNELANAPFGISVLDGTAVAPAILNTTITGNVFIQNTIAALAAATLIGGHVDGNVFYSTPLAIYIGPAARDVRVGSNTFVSVVTRVAIDPASTGSSTCTTCN